MRLPFLNLAPSMSWIAPLIAVALGLAALWLAYHNGKTAERAKVAAEAAQTIGEQANTLAGMALEEAQRRDKSRAARAKVIAELPREIATNKISPTLREGTNRLLPRQETQTK